MTLTPRDYRELLRVSLPNASDANTVPVNPRTLFTPAGHRASLEPDVTVVKGGRGVGKSVWFQALRDPDLRQIAADEYLLPQLRKVCPHTGWEPQRSTLYPSSHVLGDLLENGTRPDDIWYSVILHALGVPEVVELDGWTARTAWVRDNAEKWENFLTEADEEAEESGKIHLFMFDAVEHMGMRREAVDQLTTALLRVALDLRMATRKLRAKVFIRHDMLNNLALTFADSSKLISNAAELTWSRTNLYGLLFHYLGNSDCTQAEHFRSVTGGWKSTEHRYAPSDALVGDQDVQNRQFRQVAGPYMGNNHRKGHTYSWLPNHLEDGLGQVSPRSFLDALKRATENSAAQHAAHDFALHWEPIKHGVQAASSTRVQEISEGISWVPEAMRPLAGGKVPIELSDVIKRWQEADLPKKLELHQQKKGNDNASAGPRSYSASALVKELVQLGVMTDRKNNHLDIPDIYRIGFEIGRKGGVRRVQSS